MDVLVMWPVVPRYFLNLRDEFKDEPPLWTGKFDEPAANILKVQDSIANHVSTALSLTLNSSEKKGTEDTEAYTLYLKGRFASSKRNANEYEKAIEYFEKSIEKDRNYALAYAGLADAYSLSANASSWNRREERYNKARAAALRAIELDESLAEAHTALGWIKRNYEWDWAGAESEFKRAVELKPNSADAHQWYALLLTTLGRMPEAVAEVERARELAPTSPVVLSNVGAVYFFARRFDRSRTAFQDANEFAQGTRTNQAIARCYLMEGTYERAIELLIPEQRKSPFSSALLASAYIRSGHADRAGELIEYLRPFEKTSSNVFYYLAIIYGDQGDSSRAIQYLERAHTASDDRLLWIKVDPMIDSLRSHPRFQDLLKRMKLAR